MTQAAAQSGTNPGTGGAPYAVVVQDPRVSLTQLRQEDIPLCAEWFRDLELTAYLGELGTSFRVEDEEAWFRRALEDRNARTFGIVARDLGHLIGNVSLMSIDPRRATAELGIAIGDRTAWGLGYGTAAVRLMCDYGFTFLALQTIYLWHTAYNTRGHRAYLKAGFKLAGRLRAVEPLGGRRYDRVLMDITLADFGTPTLAAFAQSEHAITAASPPVDLP